MTAATPHTDRLTLPAPEVVLRQCRHCLLLMVLLVQVKENICKEGFVVDKDDNSLTRSNTYMLELFQKAGMSVQ